MAASSTPTALIARYQSDWGAFMREVLGATATREAKEFGFDGLTSDQVKIIRSVQEHKRTIVQSGHNVGKTRIAAWIALAFLYLYKPSQVVCTSSSREQVSKRLWAEVEKIHSMARMKLGGEITATQIKCGPGHFAYATATHDASNLHGGHPPHILCLMDEGQGVKRPIWDAFESMMGGSHARTLVLFNPLAASGPAHEAATRKRSEWKLIRMSALQHPNVLSGRELVRGAVTREWCEERLRSWGKDHPLYQAKVLGEFPALSENALISLGDLEGAKEWDASLGEGPLQGDGTWLGVDPARFGSDDTRCCVLVDGRMIAERFWNGLDTMRSCGEIHRIVAEYDIPWEHVNIDGNGLGGGIVDRLQEQGNPVNDVQFGGRVQGDWSDRAMSLAGVELGIAGQLFRNRKAELHWAARMLLKAKLLSIPERFERVWEDLLAPNYETASDGTVKVESKDEVKARINRSPDAGDSVVIALNRVAAQTAKSFVSFA